MFKLKNQLKEKKNQVVILKKNGLVKLEKLKMFIIHKVVV